MLFLPVACGFKGLLQFLAPLGVEATPVASRPFQRAPRPPAVSGRLVSKKPASGKGDGPSLDLGGGGLALAGCLDAQAQFAAHAKGGADTEQGKWGGYLSASLAKGILDVVDNPIGVGLHIPILPDV